MALSDSVMKYAAKFAQDRFVDAHDYWETNYRDRERDWEDYYRCRLPDALANQIYDPNRSELVPSDLHFLTNSFRAALTSAFKRVGTFARLSGIGPKDIENEQYAQALFDWSLQVTDFWYHFGKDMQSIAIAGYSFGILELKPLTYNVVEDGKVVQKNVFKEGKIPFYRHLDRFKCYPDKQAKILRWPDCRYFCYEDYMSREQLLSLNGKEGWQFDETKLKSATGGLTKDEEMVAKVVGYHTIKDKSGSDDAIPVLHYYGAFQEKGSDEIQQAIITVGGTEQSLPLRFYQPKYPTPYVEMFQMMKMNPDDRRLGCVGKVEAVEDDFLELFLKKNGYIDAVNLNSWGLNFFTRQSQAPTVTRVGPGIGIMVDDAAGVQSIRGGDSRSLLEAASYSKQNLREGYGNDYGLGINPGQKESATGSAFLVEAMSRDQADITQTMWHTGMKRHAELRLAMLQQYAPLEVYVRLAEDVNKGKLRMTREQSQGQFDFSLAVGVDDLTSAPVRQARIERFAAMYRGDPDWDQIKLKRLHANAYGGNFADALVVGPDVRSIAAAKESALMVKYGIMVPVNEAEDHLLHYQVHQQDLVTAMQLADEGQLLAKNVRVLQDHLEIHLSYVQAEQGLEPTSQSIIEGQGKLPQVGTDLEGSSEPAKVSETRSNAQHTAREANPFQ